MYNFHEIEEKSYNDIDALNDAEMKILNWINSFKDGSFDFDNIENDDFFADCKTEIMISRLQFESNYFEERSRFWMREYRNLENKYQNFISICHDIFGVNKP